MLKQSILVYKTIKCWLQLHLAARRVLSNNKHNKDGNRQHWNYSFLDKIQITIKIAAEVGVRYGVIS